MYSCLSSSIASTEIGGLPGVDRALGVHPGVDEDEVDREGRDLAAHQGAVAQHHVRVARLVRVFMHHHWKHKPKHDAEI